MDDATIVRWRMRNQLVRGRRPGSAAGVLERFAASQGQDLLPASWALSQRAGGLTEAAVRAECDAGAVLRTHLLRPTWHFVGASDLRWLLTATAPRVHRLNAPIYRRWGLAGESLGIVARVVESELAGGRHRTRAELGEALGAAGLPLTGQGLAYAVMWAELEGLVCSGVQRGRQQTYALVDERTPAPDGRTRQEALVELARRYFTAHGPASVRDLAGWASLTLAEARSATADAGEESLVSGGRTLWHAAGEPPSTPGGVDLVQGLDELVMGYFETRDVLLGGLAWGEGVPITYFHAVLSDGRLVGHWTYDRDGRGRPARLFTQATREWSDAETAGVAAAVADFGRFAGSAVEWVQTPSLGQ
ncbi:MAG: winged helix DNA-binding domain-containing protein [Propionicimonas sp.]